MVITRLCRYVSYNKGPHKPLNLFGSKFTRRSFSTSQDEGRPLAEQEVVNTETPPKRPAKTKMKFADLPNVYITPSGVPAKPLESMPSDGQTEDQILVDPPLKPVRKRRSKKTVQISEAPGSDEVPQEVEPKESKKTKTPKAVKPTTFLSRQILSNLKKFPHCLLLTRVGQFYESYFDQAVEISHLLNIKLTSRKWNGERVAMCGFPLLHLDKHLKTLVQQERRFVALCEEFLVRTTDQTTAKEFERRIARIVTPGTLIDESFLNPLENNYLLAISPEKAPSDCTSFPEVGLAWIDVSTGEFFSKECKLENIPDELARLAPREVVLDESLRQVAEHPIFLSFGEGNFLVSYTTASDEELSPKRPETSASNFDNLADSPTEVPIISSARESFAISLLTKFLQDNLLEHMPRLDAPLHESSHDRMQIDLHTIQGLEIRESGYEGSAKGSLLSVVKRTTTSGGARLLARWLCSPSTSIVELNNRQSSVAFFRGRPHFCADMREILNEIEDVGRLCQRFLLGRADFVDLISIRSTIRFWNSLKTLCEQEKNTENIEHPDNIRADEWSSIESLLLRLTDLEDLCEKISKAVVNDSAEDAEGSDIDNEGIVGEDEDVAELGSVEMGRNDTRKWSINPQFSKKLSSLNDTLQQLIFQKETMESDLRNKYGAQSLTLRSAPGQGMFIHLSRSRRDKKMLDLDPDFYSIGESMSTKSYIYRDWSKLGTKISEVSSAISQTEKAVFDELSLEVIEHAHQLRQNAQVIDELDVMISFAVLADEMKFVRPELSEDGSYNVVNGRHPSVEMGLLSSGRQFTPNSVVMTPSSNLHIITGPNMAGKSTLLRQTAIIAILAQIGSCVPADHAHISIVDKLFSRIGAKDDLFRDRSTFMVEMIETADILRRATDKSLVIMDEVGRGTTVKDGLAIAFAALHHLASINGSRCLFATHFHELAEMVGNTDNTSGTGIFHNVRFYCTDVDDAGDGHFTYSYRLRPGINRDSHGLKVARLAGVPSSAMDVATDTLSWLREKGSSNIQNDYDNFLKSTLKSTL